MSEEERIRKLKAGLLALCAEDRARIAELLDSLASTVSVVEEKLTAKDTDKKV